MKSVIPLGAALALVAGVRADEPLKSGLQVGQRLPRPFHPLVVTGDDAGSKVSLPLKYGVHPVAMIFAREISDPLTKLVKAIDTATADNKDCRMGSFVVFMTDDDLEKKLKDLAEREKLHQVVLALDNPAGPREYKIAKDADVTVVLYVGWVVKANYAFKEGQMKEDDVKKIVGDLKKILPKK
jgi:hypothetical protein